MDAVEAIDSSDDKRRTIFGAVITGWVCDVGSGGSIGNEATSGLTLGALTLGVEAFTLSSK